MDQSAITGESLPVSKEPGDACYITTGVLSGSAFCVVFGTGLDTFVGRTYRLVNGPKLGESSDKDLDRFISSMGLVLWASAFAVILILFNIDSRTLGANILRTWTSCVIICIYASSRDTVMNMRATTAAVMSDENAILASPLDLQTLANVDVLCSNTTGTITENRVSARSLSQWKNKVDLIDSWWL